MFLHDSDYRETEIKPGEEISLCGDRLDEQDFSFQFDHYFKKSAEAFGEDVSWQILSEHGEVLKTWGYSERDLPGRRFFEESSWDHYEQWEWSAGEFWNFTILPEDIALAE
jgi:hypothetical protein